MVLSDPVALSIVGGVTSIVTLIVGRLLATRVDEVATRVDRVASSVDGHATRLEENAMAGRAEVTALREQLLVGGLRPDVPPATVHHPPKGPPS